MPIFYLHIHEHNDFIEDPEGINAVDIDAAVTHALSGIRSIVAQQFMVEQAVTLKAIEIRDPDGNMLRTVPLREAIAGVLPDPI